MQLIMWLGSKMVMPWTANPLSSVRFRPRPPSLYSLGGIVNFFRLIMQLLFVISLFNATYVFANHNSDAEIVFSNRLVDAADKGNMSVIQSLLVAGDNIDGRAEFGVTALMRAVHNNHADIVALLLKKGADVEAVDLGGATSLHVGARKSNAKIVSMLLGNKANPNDIDENGWTPLMRAAAHNNSDVVKLLIDHGADVKKTNKWQQDALELALRANATDNFKVILKSSGASDVYKGKILAMAQKQQNKEIIALLEKDNATQVFEKVHNSDAKTASATSEQTSQIMSNDSKENKFSIEMKDAGDSKVSFNEAVQKSEVKSGITSEGLQSSKSNFVQAINESKAINQPITHSKDVVKQDVVEQEKPKYQPLNLFNNVANKIIVSGFHDEDAAHLAGLKLRANPSYSNLKTMVIASENNYILEVSNFTSKKIAQQICAESGFANMTCKIN
jgi:ankyrin repeat protein